ncbi:eukaryotic translation elongation factor 1 epsilon-1-like isoform X1 [Branchiostoma lanceolatum]|uniref:eukaryotic translation elongation factor 1 epsilon-1-like isoform X1 n=1 Tax=Branchiostoma lanceolatum TaxID=7740 RepID=UPI003455AAA4
MAVGVEEETKSLANFLGLPAYKVTTQEDLKVPQLHTGNGRMLTGLATVSKFLAKSSPSNGAKLLGTTPEEQAEIAQWLEYRVTVVDRSLEKKDVQAMLKELNSYLLDKVYFLGFHLSLADLVMYHGLHPAMGQLSFYEKQQYQNVSRWFDQIQHYPGVQQHLPQLVFLRNILYSSFDH